jgi:hypothetical protein
MGCASGEQLERVRQDVDDRLERLDRPLWRPGDVEDEALTHRTRDATRKASERTHGAHGLGQAWSFTLYDRAGRLWREIGGGESGAAGRDQQPSEARGELGEGGGHGPNSVGDDAPFDHLKAVIGERGGQFLSGKVLAGAAADGLRDSQHLGVEGHLATLPLVTRARARGKSADRP